MKEDKVLENVDTSNAGNDGKVVKDATMVGDDSNSDVEDVYDDTAHFMASSSKRASGSGGANEASLREDEDYDMYDGFEVYAYELTEEHKAFCEALIFVVNLDVSLCFVASMSQM